MKAVWARSLLEWVQRLQRTMHSSLRFLVPSAALLTVIGCAAAEPSAEDLSLSSSEVRRGKVCSAEVDVSKESFATVTADNSGVKCYDDDGEYVASIVGSVNGTQNVVRVFQGKKKTFKGKSGNFVKVRGVSRSNESEECWMSADYLCPSKDSSGKEVAGWDQSADDGAARGAACAVTSTTCCAQLTGSAKTACDQAFAKKQADARAAQQATERASTLKQIGTDCFMNASSALTWDGVAENARACCEEKLEIRAEIGSCIARVDACKDASVPGGFTGSRVCP